MNSYGDENNLKFEGTNDFGTNEDYPPIVTNHSPHDSEINNFDDNLNEDKSYSWNEDDMQIRINSKIPENKSLNVIKPKYKKSHKGIWQILVIALIGSIIGSTLTCALFMFTQGKYTHTPNNKIYTNSSRPSESVNPSIVETASDRKLTNSEIHEKVGPAVVGITNKSIATNIFLQQTQTESSGSGIIISADGYIITNNHVIEGSRELTVSLISGETYPATLIGSDSVTDLAVLKIDAQNLPYAILGDSSTLKAGERVVAIGNPLMQELAGTVTAGILSATNRSITVTDENPDGSVTTKKMTLLQTDAAINPGNSGGALINAYGEVIGINTLKTVSSGVEGLGFAIPINEAKPIIDSLMEKGYVSRPTIGINVVTVTEQLSRQYDLPVGLYIQSINQFSAAERAGLRVADVIIKCNGETVYTADELNDIKNQHQVGDVLTLTINRNGEIMDIDLTLLEDKSSSQATTTGAFGNDGSNGNGYPGGSYPYGFGSIPGLN